MRNLKDSINEAVAKYQISANYKKVIEKTCKELQALLPSWDGSKKDNNYYMRNSGGFWYNKYDYERYPCETAKYIGRKIEFHCNLNCKKENIDIELISLAFKNEFGFNITEGIFDDNANKNLREYEFIVDIKKALEKYFKTNNFSMVDPDKPPTIIPGASLNKLSTNNPTIEDDFFFISLYGVNIYCPKYDPSWMYVNITIVIYEEKDPEMVKFIKGLNDSRKAIDVAGRELMVGDTIAYNPYGSAKALELAEVLSISKEQIQIQRKGQSQQEKVYGNRCCIVSRKDGKMIK